MSPIQYILDFLHCTSQVHYLRKEEIKPQHRIVILRSNFWDTDTYLTPNSMPKMPLQKLEGMPILFGKANILRQGQQLIIEADLIASAYFLLSRYEEIFAHENQKDKYGRLLATQSILFLSSALDTPLIDQYTSFISKCIVSLGLAHTPYQPKVSINLTHDVDSITFYQSIRGSIGGLLRALIYPNHTFKPIFQSWFNCKKDSAFVFPWMIEQDNKLPQAQIHYFFKGVQKAIGLDYPKYTKSALKKLLKILPDSTHIGLHTSTQANKNKQLILQEKKQVEKWINKKVTSNRWHFLYTTYLESFAQLERAGITDDYSMGFADRPGFRMGTARPFLWINPKSQQITNITIHPLLIMDVSLSNANYLNFNEKQAYEVCLSLIQEVERYGGEINLLWHNNAFTSINSYSFNHKALYEQIIFYLQNK